MPPCGVTGATAAALIPDGSYLQGYKRLKASQLQMTATKSEPNVLGAEQLILLGEAGVTYFHNLPTDVKFNGPAVYLPATAFGAVLSSAFSVQDTGFLTSVSWGYRLVGRLDYANAFLGGNLSPRLAWAHDNVVPLLTSACAWSTLLSLALLAIACAASSGEYSSPVGRRPTNTEQIGHW